MENKNFHIHTQLALQAGNGDQVAQFKIYELYAKAMFNTAVRILNDHMLAEEKMQDAFIIAFHKIDKWHQKASFGAWLKRVVINECLDHLAKKKLELVSLEDHHGGIDDDFTEDAEEGVIADVAQVKAAMATLPEGYRLILSLYLFEGYDHEEIAEILNISSATSRSQYLRGKKKLVSLIEKRNYA